MVETATNLLEEIYLPVALPDGASIHRQGKYLRVAKAHSYPIANFKGEFPYHRYVLYERLQQPVYSCCRWCRYVLPWKSTLGCASLHVVNADHLDGDKSNNDPYNLAPSCGWCNKNRNWAEKHPDFWEQWRRWMADVPPWARPNLIAIAEELGLTVDRYWENSETKEPDPF